MPGFAAAEVSDAPLEYGENHGQATVITRCIGANHEESGHEYLNFVDYRLRRAELQTGRRSAVVIVSLDQLPSHTYLTVTCRNNRC